MDTMKEFLEACRESSRQTREEQLKLLHCTALFLEAVEAGLEKAPLCWMSLTARGYKLKNESREQAYQVIRCHNTQVAKMEAADKRTLCESCKRSGCMEQLRNAGALPPELVPCAWVTAGKDMPGWEIWRRWELCPEEGEEMMVERTRVLSCPHYTPQYEEPAGPLLTVAQWRILKQRFPAELLEAERQRLSQIKIRRRKKRG